MTKGKVDKLYRAAEFRTRFILLVVIAETALSKFQTVNGSPFLPPHSAFDMGLALLITALITT